MTGEWWTGKDWKEAVVVYSGYYKEGNEKIHGEQLDSLCMAKIQTGYALLY